MPLAVGHDFEYVYVDQDPIIWAGKKGEEGYSFASTLFNKRAKASTKKYKNITLSELLGDSPLLNPTDNEWGPTSNNIVLLRKYASEITLNRAEKLLNYPNKFSDQIARKIHSALLLRDAIQSKRGHEEITLYSGVSLVVRCGDANPRRLITIFNNLLMEIPSSKYNKHHLSPRTQSKVLITFSTTTLETIQSEEKYGHELYDFIRDIGDYMNKSLYTQPLSTDQISSIVIDKTISDTQWNLVKAAVGLGLLFPNISTANPNQLPERHGVFRLAYVLAPHFRLLPRKGKPVRISTIINYSKEKFLEPVKFQMPLFSPNQEEELQ